MVPTTKTEADVQRAVKARRERQTRRATQGVTLDSLQKGKQMYAIALKSRLKNNTTCVIHTTDHELN